MKKVRKPREPSKASLREFREVDFQKAKVRRNPYAARIAAEGFVRVGRGIFERFRKVDVRPPTQAGDPVCSIGLGR